MERLFRQPWRFEVFQAVRLLEAAGRRRGDDGLRPALREVGADADPGREAVRFRAKTSSGFPSAAVADLRQPAAPGDDPAKLPPPELTVTHLGLFGPSGALPHHMTDLIVRNIRRSTASLRDFLDLFNHRLIALFHRAWEKYRLPYAYERGGRGGRDKVSEALHSITGFGTASLRGRMAIDDEAVLHYSGILSHRPRSAIALQAMLSDYFERPVRIRQFVGAWSQLASDEQSRLPTRKEPEGVYCQLGVNAVAGTRVWDVQGRFRIEVGPLTLAQFVQFMPGHDALTRLAHLTRLYIGPGMSFDVQLTLDRHEVPRCKLGGEGGARLGWTSWIKTDLHPKDVSDAVFDLDRI